MRSGLSENVEVVTAGKRQLSTALNTAKAQQIEAKKKRFPLERQFFPSSIAPSSGATAPRWHCLFISKRTTQHGNC
jgi:hypothetical protein